jgi:hypothetical protein
MIRGNTINLEPMSEIYYVMHVVTLPDTTIQLKTKAISGAEVEQIIKHDRKRYMLINFQGVNGATYLYNKSERRVIAKVVRKCINELNVEPTGLPMRHYEFV